MFALEYLSFFFCTGILNTFPPTVTSVYSIILAKKNALALAFLRQLHVTAHKANVKSNKLAVKAKHIF